MILAAREQQILSGNMHINQKAEANWSYDNRSQSRLPSTEQYLNKYYIFLRIFSLIICENSLHKIIHTLKAHEQIKYEE